MTKPLPIYNVCYQCGIAANVLTCLAKYGQLPKQLAFSVSTFHKGTCDCCRRTDIQVTETRDYYHPNFKLINKIAWRNVLKKDYDKR